MKNKEFEALFLKAEIAGMEAAQAIVPTPMTVQGYAPVMDGVCGFAWITIRPGNCAFANWLKANGHARPAYGGGVQIWISRYNQSMTRKEAHAYAMAQVLQGQGVTAYAGSRMD